MASRRSQSAVDTAEADMLARLTGLIMDTRRRLINVEKREISQATRSMLRFAVADLPTPSVARAGWIAFATDGRKSGEGAGNGTGVPVYCGDNGAGTYLWLTYYGNTEVQA